MISSIHMESGHGGTCMESQHWGHGDRQTLGALARVKSINILIFRDAGIWKFII